MSSFNSPLFNTTLFNQLAPNQLTPITTVQDVMDDARAHLRDDIAPEGGVLVGGTVWTNDALQLHFNRAYRKMFDAMKFGGSNRIRREWYFLLPSYTSLLVPYVYDIVDLGEPELVEERDQGTVGAIASTDTSSPVIVETAAPHLLATNADVIIQEVVGTSAARGRFYITVIDDTHFSLNGSISDGNEGTGGYFSSSSTKFTTVDPIDSLTDRSISTNLLDYTWEEGVFKFRGAQTARQLHVQYVANGTAPQVAGARIGVEDSLNFLGAATAYYASRANGWYQHAAELKIMAFGPKGEGDGSGGFLRDLINSQVLKAQRKPRAMGPFRKPRNQTTSWWY